MSSSTAEDEEKTSNKRARTESSATPEKREKSTDPARRFSRINREKVQFESGVLQDNTYKGAAGTWGTLANEKLTQVRGKDFTKNKNKMKKGGYRGGTIELTSGSYKFTD
ncbi:SRP40, C-terminal domain-containing protein [Kockiozyma suomiensis]|uniref:SRP40, C-terminal domain-containing protein n=1 Tax=Kockiozyma suomiensis TaxID=1337062 RepID=UPI003343C591